MPSKYLYLHLSLTIQVTFTLRNDTLNDWTKKKYNHCFLVDTPQTNSYNFSA